ncbi:hypothetical protein B0I35DRAFT_465636 [Stachybotrys elegans]|uniref:Transcription factor domain-containing protein n=1 Tax=Stachybotrys elegans TaxID=80388 RepID=A0A8K0SGM8_9HYPO|nr:hypothetical protein B0I35DRAFT_465636 [Stachybotrys elegans]
MQFIITNDPTKRAAKGEIFRVHVHAARVTHARARQIQMRNYQAQKKVAVLSEDKETNAGKEPMPDPINALSEHRRDPFNILSKRLSPIEQYLFDHYITVVLPYVKAHGRRVTHEARSDLPFMDTPWVRLAVVDADMMQALLFTSCRHLAGELDPCRNTNSLLANYMQMGAEYKLSCVRSVRQSISKNMITDAMLTLILVLALDEIRLQDYATAQKHVSGFAKAVELFGGPKAINLRAMLGLIMESLRACQCQVLIAQTTAAME